MTNQMYLWGSVIFPWVTLLFLKKEDAKRYMPVALFGALLTTIVGEFGLALNWWNVKEAVFPFYHMPPYTYGAFPVGIIWIFKLTYKRFLLFMFTNAAFDFALTFPILSFTVQRGIIELVNITSFQLFLISIVQAAVLYGYQIWQEGVLVSPPEKSRSYLANLQPAATKPLQRDPKEDAQNGEKEKR